MIYKPDRNKANTNRKVLVKKSCGYFSGLKSHKKIPGKPGPFFHRSFSWRKTFL